MMRVCSLIGGTYARDAAPHFGETTWSLDQSVSLGPGWTKTAEQIVEEVKRGA
jgi:hypothetical protein